MAAAEGPMQNVGKNCFHPVGKRKESVLELSPEPCSYFGIIRDGFVDWNASLGGFEGRT